MNTGNTGGRLLSIGECMVELKQAEGGLLRKGYAGDTFNAAYYSRLFLPADWQVDYLTAVGEDAVSDDMLDFMAGVHIGTGFVRRIEGGTPGLYMIHLKEGERSFSYWRSASAAKRLADDPQHLRRAIGESDVIVFSGITLAILEEDAAAVLIEALGEAKAAGRTIVFDPNIRPRLWNDKTRMLETISKAARVSTLVMPSFDDEAMHFGDPDIAATLTRYRDLGVASIVVKDGEKGVTLAIESEATAFVPAARVSHVVDTTSAGDSFNGAFLAHYVTGRDAKAAARFAAEIAARVIGHHGALVDKARLLPET